MNKVTSREKNLAQMRKWYRLHRKEELAKKKIWYATHKTAVVEQRRDYYLKHGDDVKLRQRTRRRGLTVEQFTQMLDRQQGKCLICETVPQDHVLQIDHDHRTGVVRGLLCRDCNSGLGRFQDNAGLLKKAATYLRRQG
jgi:NAD-dependent dihydropyrimidine dehydrogenase PreA subunit